MNTPSRKHGALNVRRIWSYWPEMGQIQREGDSDYIFCSLMGRVCPDPLVLPPGQGTFQEAPFG